jgi:hypothetical protein
VRSSFASVQIIIAKTQRVGESRRLTLLHQESVVMSNSEGSNQAAFALMQAELTRLREGALAAWSTYLNFFTWALGAESVILGLIVTQKAALDGPYMIMLTSAIIVLNMLGVPAGLKIGSFVSLQGKRADLICGVMTGRAEESGLNITISSGFSGEFINFYARLCVVALSTAAVGWTFLLCYTVRHFKTSPAIIAAIAALF